MVYEKNPKTLHAPLTSGHMTFRLMPHTLTINALVKVKPKVKVAVVDHKNNEPLPLPLCYYPSYAYIYQTFIISLFFMAMNTLLFTAYC